MTDAKPRPAAPTRQRFRTALGGALLPTFDLFFLLAGGVSVVTAAWQLLVRLPWAAFTRDAGWRRFRLVRCAIYLGAAALTFGLARFDAHVAEQRAADVLQALTRFEREQRRFPAKLDALVPAYLPQLPAVHPLAPAEKFIYRSFPKSEDRPASPPLFGYRIVAPMGWVMYDFEASRWEFRD